MSTFEARLHCIAYDTATTRSFEFRADSNLPPFEPGAHIDVHLPDGAVRQYSLCNDPSERHRYVICVRREDAGRGGSRAVHQRLHVGDTVRLGPPRNNFALEPASRYVLVGGGIGVTPLVAMAHRLLKSQTPFEFDVYARDTESTPLLEVLQSGPLAPHVRLHTSATGDSVRTELPKSVLSPDAGARLYVCGPEGFMDHLHAGAVAAGWTPERIHRERFAPASVAPEVAPGELDSFTVVVASTGARINVEPEQSIATALTDHGVQVELSCEQGMCGACLTGVLAGVPAHRDDVQTDAERASNTAVTICCSRSRTPELVLDL